MCKSSGICAQNKAVSPPKYIIKHAKNNFFLVGGYSVRYENKKKEVHTKTTNFEDLQPF